jgi:hypothetical protein
VDVDPTGRAEPIDTRKGNAAEALAAAAFATTTAAVLIARHRELTDVDGAYHVRLAAIYLREGIRRDMPWMTCSVTSEVWADQHFLFHALLAPFTALVQPSTVLRWGGAPMAGLAAAAAALYLRAAHVTARWFFLVALVLASYPFFLRQLSVRSIALSVAWLVAALACIERRRDRSLLAVTYGYTLTYQFALVVPFLALADAVFSRRGPGRFRGVLLAALGVTLGLTINPFFPATWDYLFAHILPYFTASATHRGAAQVTAVGTEWLPLDGSLYVDALGAPLLLVALAVWARRRTPRADDGLPLAALATGALTFALAAAYRRRFTEYAAPLSVLLAARLLGRRSLAQCVQPPALVVAPMVLWGLWNLWRIDVGAFYVQPDALRGASQWIAGHTAPGEVVFHGRWGDFPLLFFHNPRNRYLYGLDPYFFSTWNLPLYLRYRDVWAGRDPSPVDSILRHFHSRVVLITRAVSDQPLALQLRNHPRVMLGYRDGAALVLMLRP